MAEQQNKPHRKAREEKTSNPGNVNPKANAFANPGRLQKQAARSHDVREKRLHVPLVDRLPEEAPPLVVGVVGPPQVGKTTLIKSLIRRYTKQTLTNPTGPLTVVTSKRRRLTFIECPSESLASMIDVAKVVDIVLLMIDGSYGFEMETMEFLNVLSSSGMPGNVFGILTKLDLFKKQDTLRTRKKQLKHRFWSELYQGAKLFYLSGIVNGRYPDREILNLSRFLSVMKNPRPLVWRNSHPYCLVDRYVDVTPPTAYENHPKCDRSIALYGYLRGTNFPAQGTRVHVPGVGDLTVANVEALPDPCPTPYIEQAVSKATGKAPRKRLGEKQKVLFAPMSDVGGVLMDKDAVYVDIRRPHFDRDDEIHRDRGFGEQMVVSLQGDRRLLGEAEDGVQLFSNAGTSSVRHSTLVDDTVNRKRRAAPYNTIAADMVDKNEVESEDDSDEDQEKSSNQDDGGRIFEDGYDSSGNGAVLSHSNGAAISSDEAGDASQGDDDSSDNDSGYDSEDGGLAWKLDLARKAQDLHNAGSQRRTADLSRLMYDISLTPTEAVRRWHGRETSNEVITIEDRNDGDEFFSKSKTTDGEDSRDDRTIPNYDAAELKKKWTIASNVAALRKRFISIHLNKRGDDAEVEGLEGEDGVNDSDQGSGSDRGGDFEDLEAGQSHSDREPPLENNAQHGSLDVERQLNAKRKEELKLRFEEEDREGFANPKATSRQDQPDAADREFGEDEWYDAQKAKMQKQLDINRAEFNEMDQSARVRVEGYKAGTYARVLLENVPYEFAACFSPRYPVIIGGLNPTEERFGFNQVRIKRHRWHTRILKNNDPLIFSLGWRRFQSIPMYSTSDSRTRNRMLKYTPEHMHCFGTFYGPLIAPNSGFVAVQSLSNKTPGFRIAATGVVLSVDESTQIVKKLKLKGYPHKIYKNTAIIRDMFASELEAVKFKAANIKTVSGIRGMVKGRAGNQYPDGYVRVGFEDKILKSDIVFLSTWYEVKPREFYMPVTNLLMSSEATFSIGAADAADDGDESRDNAWQGMRLTGAVRASLSIPTPTIKDSAYTKMTRPERHFNPLRVPRTLAASLPYKSQITQMAPRARNAETYLQKRAVVLGGEEKKARDLMHKIQTLRNEKVKKRAEAQERRKEPHRKLMRENAEKKEAREKREKQEYWEREGRKRRKTEDGSGNAKRRKKS
ncbi:MAG: Glycoside hydrolase 2 (Mannanase, beta-galactosidase) [Chrysothrix sp. TS-e1954]|nr:MAG: Glycoside hydrolase 2 (Mannanase, beta-galactosidase) [Chrysothrix sp. TS-e1954]